MSKEVTVNRDQRLYVIPCNGGYSCKGWEYAHNQAAKVVAWMEATDLPLDAPLGTLEHYAQCERVIFRGRLHASDTGTRCTSDLCPQLDGLEGRRVEVLDAYGEKRRFIVGRSTGWMPIHLEIKTRASSGGGGAYGTPYQWVRTVNA